MVESHTWLKVCMVDPFESRETNDVIEMYRIVFPLEMVIVKKTHCSTHNVEKTYEISLNLCSVEFFNI